MPIKSFSEETHVRKHRVLIDHKDLAELVAKAAAETVDGFCKPRIGRDGTTYKVEFADALEGSPGYRVGTKATVTIIEDLAPQSDGDA